MIFNQPSLIQNTLALLPEITVVVTLLIVIVLSLLLNYYNWLFNIALLGLIIAISMLLFQWNNVSSTRFLFLGSIQIDGVNTSFRAVILLSGILSILLSKEYTIRSGMPLVELIILILSATLGAMFLCMANDLITLFVALEYLSISSYALAGYTKKDIRSNEAAMKYLLLGGASSAILGYGFSWLYGLSGGQIQLQQLLYGIKHHFDNPLPIFVAFTCIIAGIGFKISAVPFHQWTPDVYEGSPTPVVAFLSVGSKAAGLIFGTRVLSIAFSSIEQEWHLVAQALSALSMILGNLIASNQHNLKRMLSYSSISQTGYLLMAIIAGNSYGYSSLVIYMITYVFMNLGAFACVIMFGLRTGTDQIRDYTGLYFKDPWLAVSLSICLLSLGGIPPFAGFFGKLYMFWCGWNAGLYWLVYIGLITNVVSMYYYLKVIKIMLIKEAKQMSPYVQHYAIPTRSIIPQNTIQFVITLCVIASTTIGLIINPVIVTTSQLINYIL
jgi:NAD(P)H-quinone oxidoreductase subunit 2